MKKSLKWVALVLCLCAVCSSVACVDLGVGEDEDDYKKYFSSVYLISPNGVTKKKYSYFDSEAELDDVFETNENGDIIDDDFNLDDALEVKKIGFQKFSYICFKASQDYTLTVDEFAFFARTHSGEGVLDIEFFVSDVFPTKMKDVDDGSDVYIPEDNGEDDEMHNQTDVAETDEDGNIVDSGEIDEDIFNSMQSFYSAKFNISEEWDSVHLVFNEPQMVGKGQINKYVVVRIKNNSYIADSNEESVKFTLNCPLFRFSEVVK